MEKFTASEVRDHAIWVGGVAGMGNSKTYTMLHAYADRLEVDETAAPVYQVEGDDSYEWKDCSKGEFENTSIPFKKRILYTHPAPADAERLAEALRNLVSEWVAIADDGDATLEDSTIGYRACANRLSAMLATHSAQAQPHTVPPEHSCEECGGQNVTWFAPSELWNEVVRSPDGYEPMLCPMCFIKRAEKAGHSKDAWSVRPEFYEDSAQPPAASVMDAHWFRARAWLSDESLGYDRWKADMYSLGKGTHESYILVIGEIPALGKHLKECENPLAAQENPNG